MTQHNGGGISQYFHMIAMQGVKGGENYFIQCLQTLISKFPPTECNIIYTDVKLWPSQLRNKWESFFDTQIYNNNPIIWFRRINLELTSILSSSFLLFNDICLQNVPYIYKPVSVFAPCIAVQPCNIKQQNLPLSNQYFNFRDVFYMFRGSGFIFRKKGVRSGMA
jgi:hypothetical protein